MNTEVLISTMNLIDNNQLLEKMNIKTNSVTINQVTEKTNLVNIENSKNRLYNYYEKGLSKSRNKAIENAKEDICIIADDDLVYENDYENIIKKAYEENKDADIITFYVQRDKQTLKNEKIKRIKYLNSMKISSVQITFKRQSILKSKIKFDENFGAGSGKYLMGEENIFLFDCLRKKIKIYFVPIKIAEENNSESTWFRGFNSEYFISKGACFYRMSRFFSDILIIQFAIRKRKLFRENYNFLTAIKIMLKGKKEYKKYIKGKINEQFKRKKFIKKI